LKSIGSRPVLHKICTIALYHEGRLIKLEVINMSKQWRIIASVISAIVVVDVMSVVGWFNVVQNWTLVAFAQNPDAVTQVEVRLIDDDQDGIPDRGVVDLPARVAYSRGFEPDRGRPFRPPFAPFALIAGLIRGLIGLAFLALLISLTVFIYRRWQPAPAVTLVKAPVAPIQGQPPSAATPLAPAGGSELTQKE
jgi:hypothetical protein